MGICILADPSRKPLDFIGRQEGMTMLIGYARTSTLEQKAGLEAQIESLTAIGCEKVYKEQTSSVATREALKASMEFSREGDTIIVTKLDRLARSVRHLGEILEHLETKKVGLRVLDLGLDTGTATGKLMLNVLGSVAQFEREMMLERQREGIAKAKAEGRYKGRKPTALQKSDEVHTLLASGATKRQAARQLGISERSVYRIAAISSGSQHTCCTSLFM
jgi:DNA invertase Pin-like site-specific DNA recombinase